MQKLSMAGFREMCKQIAPASYIFTTENQPGGMCEDAKHIMRYTDVVFMMNPNRICFTNEMGTLCFDRVKSIECCDSCNMVGRVFCIVCGSTAKEDADVSYTVIADEKIF